MVIGFGFSIAGSILVGQRLGAGDIEGARKTLWRAAQQTVIVLSLLGFLFAPFAHDLSLWLVKDPEVADLTTTFIYILCITQPFIALDMALGGALRGAGDTRFPLYSTLVGLIGMRFGVALLFLWLDLSVVWVYATIIGDYLIKNWLMIRRINSDEWLQVHRSHAA
jgi:Na+-driven multidrug efflux pump